MTFFKTFFFISIYFLFFLRSVHLDLFCAPCIDIVAQCKSNKFKTVKIFKLSVN